MNHTDYPGIIISLSALVAAGIAVYESPQFRQWVDNSRRKLAQALHNLGDEVQPRESASLLMTDASMTEETGPAAEERRRVVRETLERRRSQLSALSKKRDNSPPSSFDTLVDNEGKLLNLDDDVDAGSKCVLGTSTGVDLGDAQMTQRGKAADASTTTPDGNGHGLHIDMPALQPQPVAPSTTQWTPTSEAPGFGHVASRPESPLSSHTEGYSFDETHRNLQSPFSEMGQADHAHPERSSTPSTASSFSHVYESADALSDGTMSEFGQTDGGVATPASWSEVGSVISNDDINYQHF